MGKSLTLILSNNYKGYIMKKLLFLTATILTIAFASNIVLAQASATATASATMITPIAITKSVDMVFGNIAVQNGTGGTVVLATDGSRTRTSGVTLPTFATGSPTAASFSITGEGTYTYAITLPATAVITNGTPAQDMTVSSFVSLPSGTGALTAGAQTLLVGATLTVAAAQPAGTYTCASFSVTVNYN